MPGSGWLRSSDPDHQVREVLGRFDLFGRIRAFQRCMECNGTLGLVGKQEVLRHLPARTAESFDEFYRCRECGKVYWKGSHHDKMKMYVQDVLRWGNLTNEEPSD